MHNIVVVEDEYLVRIGIQVSITGSGLPVRISAVLSNGSEALDLILNQSAPDILITDIMLPGITGIELIRKIREAQINCKIIVITCIDDVETHQKLAEYNIDAYLFKATMTARELTEAIEKLLNEQSSDIIRKPEYELGNVSMIQNTNRYEILQIQKYITDNLDKPLNLQALADKAGFSANYLSNLFTQECGVNLVAYINHVRLEKSKELLANLNLTVFDIASKCGFNNESYFSRIFKTKYGVSPGRYRRGLLNEYPL